VELVKKLEIITNSLEIKAVLGILDKVGVSGYTIIKDIDGQGDKGRA
jgi:nitrogen regulatory protein PII